MNKQIKYGALISYCALFLNILIGLVYTPWMIRSIGKADYGLYTLAISVISLFVFDFGLSSAVTRFVAKYLAEGRQDRANQLISVTYRLYVIASIVVFVLLLGVFFFIPQIYKGLTEEELMKFKVLYVIAASYSVLSFPFIPLDGIIAANEKFIQLKLCNLAHKLFIVLTMSCCLILGFGLYALVIVNAVAGVFTIILKLLVVKRFTLVRVIWGFWDRDMFKAIIAFSIWVTVSALAQRLVLNLCPSILGIVSDSQSIAVFGVAMTIEGYVYTFASAINGLFLPRVTQLDTNQGSDSILGLMIKVGRIQFLILGAILTVFVCCGQNFINAWIGEEYAEVYLCSLLMVAPSFISLAEEIGQTTIVVRGEVKASALICVIKALTNVVLAFPLAKFFGVYGMALSIFVSYSVSTVLFNVFYHRRLGLNIPAFFKASLSKMYIPMIVCVGLGFLPDLVISNEGWVHFIIRALYVGTLYILTMFFFVMNKAEKDLFFGRIKRLLN